MSQDVHRAYTPRTYARRFCGGSAGAEGVETGLDAIAQVDGGAVVIGHVVGVIDGERLVHRRARGEEGRLGIGATVVTCDCQLGDGDVFLRRGPVQRMIGAGADLKRCAVGGDGLGQQCGTLCALGAAALV